jgi:iron(III) transport system permease protein
MHIILVWIVYRGKRLVFSAWSRLKTGAAPVAPVGAATVLVALALAAPALALAVLALAGMFESTATLSHLGLTVLPRYAATTALLTAAVVVIVLAVGVGAAWLIAAFEFPGRRALAWVLVLPMAMPAFVMGYAYTDFLAPSGALQSALRRATGWEIGDYWFPDVHSWPSAALCLGLALYPYVYLLARTAFAERSASLAEAARTLGLGPFEVWWRVTWPVARPAVAAGVALATMETLADFGTVSYFAVDTFTAGIFRAWQSLGDRAGAAQLALVLLVVVMALVWIERIQRGRMQFHARSTQSPARTVLRGARAWGAFVACAMPGLLGFVVPAVLLLVTGAGSESGVDARLLDWVANTALLGAGGAALVVPLALLGAYALRVSGGRWVRLALGLANTGYAIPGLVLGVGLLVLAGLTSQGLAWMGALIGWQTPLIAGGIAGVYYAYTVRFFPVGFQGIDAGLRRISPSMDQSARSLGRGFWGVLREVHWPLMRRTVAVAGLLVFVDSVKELPATLVLRPFDFDTLAVVAYHFAADERLAEAAWPSLLIVLVGLVPVVWLSRITLSDPSGGGSTGGAASG